MMSVLRLFDKLSNHLRGLKRNLDLDLAIETFKARINAIAFAQITVLAKRMHVAHVVSAAFGEGNNMVDVKWRFLSRFTAALALKAIAF
jgi:hypothetical protein